MLTKRIILHHLVPALAFTIFFSACSGKSNNDAVVKAMEESLANSNLLVYASTQQILHSLEEKTQTPAAMERAAIWFSKAKHIAKISENISNYIEEWKKEINLEKTNELFTRLIKYKEDVLNTDSSIRYEFANYLTLITKSFDSSGKSGNDFWGIFFKKTNSRYASGMLTMIQNNIKTIENRIVNFCYHKIGSLDGDSFFDSYSSIVGQSSTYLKAGEQLEITAGIGTFSTAAKPKIIINGKIIEIGDEGFALHKIKAPKKPGNYTIPVTLSFLDITTGKDMTKTINVEYTVAKECDQ